MSTVVSVDTCTTPVPGPSTAPTPRPYTVPIPGPYTTPTPGSSTVSTFVGRITTSTSSQLLTRHSSQDPRGPGRVLWDRGPRTGRPLVEGPPRPGPVAGEDPRQSGVPVGHLVPPPVATLGGGAGPPVTPGPLTPWVSPEGPRNPSHSCVHPTGTRFTVGVRPKLSPAVSLMKWEGPRAWSP